MKYLIIQNICRNTHVIKIIINIILLTFYNQYKQCCCTSNIQNNHISKTFIPNKKEEKKINDTKIIIQSNQFKLNLSNQETYFSGNVSVKHNNSILYADEISLYEKKNNKDKTTHMLLSGLGNIYYIDNIFKLTGKKILINTQNKNIDFYQNTFNFETQKIRGTSYYIKQRQNNYFSILKKSSFTTCPSNKKYWQITGSQILYDHKEDILDIWDMHFILGKIPIFYIPYLQLPLTNKKYIKYYYPIPKYSNKYGIEIKLPYYFNINKYYHGKIITNLIPKRGIQLQNSIQHSNKMNYESINFNILNNTNIQKNKNSWILQWKNNNFIQKKWNVKANYLLINDPYNLYNEESKYIFIKNNNYIKKKLLCKYINTMWNINFSYQELQSPNDYIKNIYNIKPQLNINFHTNKYKLLNYHLFSQITQFKNTNHNYPKTIRMHIEPTINISSNISNTYLNNEIKLKTTHYQQKNIDFYNKTIHNKNDIHLQKFVNRYIPQLKSNATITFQKKRNALNKYRQIVAPKIQYLYIPYRNQKNIALYDTTIFQISQNNLFDDHEYTGLDRIISTNQLTTGINTKIFNKKNIELFNISLEQTYSFKSPIKNNHINNIMKYKNNTHYFTWNINNYCNIHNILGINTDFQYNTQIKKLKSGNTVIEYRTNKDTILQINYRYLNSKYFAHIIQEPTTTIYQKNISQIGLIGNWPINNTLTISSTQYFDIQSKNNINQTIGIQYRTCCWKMNAGYERTINFLNKKNTKNIKKHNNKLLINIIILYEINNDLQSYSQICDTLHTSALPYQTIL